MEVTRIMRRGHARAVAPPSPRAQILLVLSAFLCGTVLAGLLFVGIWRHTAADGVRARSAQAAEHRLLRAAQRRTTSLTATLASEHRRADRATAALAAERRRLTALGRAVPPKLDTLASSARKLTSQLATLQSELRALETYVQGGAVDPGYVDAQAQYLVTSTRSAAAAASAILRDVEDVQGTTSNLVRAHG
jgi:hypothetical protein